MKTRCLISCAGLAVMAAAAFSPVAFAQDDDPDSIATPVVQRIPQVAGTRELNGALSRLAANSRDVDALIDAGNAAALLGDFEAAMGFFGRADQIDPANGRVKAGLATALLRNENPYDALRYFDEAMQAGVVESSIAADRGLAYDLVGENARAQRDYQIAMSRAPSDELIRRYALSLAIAGDRRAADSQLLPLLRRQDAAAWRTRAFIYAINGDDDEAISIAYATMPRDMAENMAPYLRYMTRLTKAQKAAAANFGHFPRAAQIGRDDPRVARWASASGTAAPAGGADGGLVPVGEPLGTRTAARTATRSDPPMTTRPSRDPRRRPGGGSATPTPTVTVAVVPPRPAAQTASAAASPRVAELPPVAVAAASPASIATTIPAPAATAATSGQELPPIAETSVQMVQATPSPMPSVPVPATTSAGSAAPGFDALANASVPANPPPFGTPAVSTAPANPPPFGTPATPVTNSSFDLARIGSAPAQAQAQAPTVALTPASAEVMAAAAPPVAEPVSATPVTSPAPAPTVATAAVVAASTPSAPRPSLDSLFSDYQAPADETRQNAVAAVDITRIQPARPRPPAPAPAPAAAAAATAAPASAATSGRTRPGGTATPAGANAVQTRGNPPAAGQTTGRTAARASAPTPATAHPSRVWVQLATSPDRNLMGSEWRRLGRIADEALRGKRGYVTPWRSNFRLLTGPFDSERAAQQFLNELGKADVQGFVWTSAVGQVIDSLPASGR